MNYSEEIEKVHEELIEQENINESELPEDIQKKIKGWNLLFSRLVKNPEDDKLYRSLQKTSIQLADKIQNFIESDYEEEEELNNSIDEKKIEDSSEEKESEKNTDSSEVKKREEEKEEYNKIKTDKVFGNLVMEKKIMQALDSDKKISLGELTKIIGKEPDYPEQKVNAIKLRKVFMSSKYRLA